MRNRIEILKEIMTIEKQFALEEIDSEIFEKKTKELERELASARDPSEEEIRKSRETREVPLGAHQLVGLTSIEELILSFDVPRGFFRHLKVRRELLELEREIYRLKHDLKKIKILLAEKKVSKESTLLKIDDLEFELRSSENRYGARDKYLKRNLTKGDLLKFTIENYLKFPLESSEINKEELDKLIFDLEAEIKIRKKYREALAEMLATIKASQLEVSSTTKINGLPDFKYLRELQKAVNEIIAYITILTEDIKEYSNALILLQERHKEIDDLKELFVVNDFGIETITEEKEEIKRKDREILPSARDEIDLLLETFQLEGENGYLSLDIDTLETSERRELEEGIDQELESSSLKIPKAPYPLYKPRIEIEIEGMEDFTFPFNIEAHSENLNEMTEQIIYRSFEGLLIKLIDETSTTPKKMTQDRGKIPSAFTSLAEDLAKTHETSPQSLEGIIQEPRGEALSERLVAESESEETITPDNIEAEITAEESDTIEEITADFSKEIKGMAEISALDEEALKELEPMEEIPESELIDAVVENKIGADNVKAIDNDSKLSAVEQSLSVPPIPQEQASAPPPLPVEELASKRSIPPPRDSSHPASTKPIKQLKEAKVESAALGSAALPESLIQPTKTSMIPQELMNAATQAWRLTGKALFVQKEDGTREFSGYLQEVVIYDSIRLGYSLVSESVAGPVIIENIFDQIKPIWLSEELAESPKKRKEFLIQEVVKSLQVNPEVALHISTLKEFANFRNIIFPIEESTLPAKMFGIVPINVIRIKGGMPYCKQEDILYPRTFRTAPWVGTLEGEDNNPVTTDCFFESGAKLGEVIAVINHPMLGYQLLIDIGVPDGTLIEYLEQRLEIGESDPKERVWLVKYFIAKQLRIPEGEALKPKTLINYSINRGYPILPNEILNSYRVLVSFGSIDRIEGRTTILKRAARAFHPSEVLPIECLRVRTIHGKHVGLCIGISLSDKPVMLVSEKLSREVVSLFTEETIEKNIMADISQSVIGTLGVGLKDALCTHNILKTLIATRRIQTLADYGMFLSKMAVTGIELSRVRVVEKGTIYIDSSHTDSFEN